MFAWLWLICFGLFGVLTAYRAGAWSGEVPLGWQQPWKAALVIWSAALVVGIAGIAYPRLVRPVYVAWLALSFPIGWTISNVLLLVTYYIIFTLVSVILRIVGHDPLNRRFETRKSTYWSPHERVTAPARYFQQF